MRAARFAAFGGPEVLSIEDIPVPKPAPGEVRVRVEAAAIQPFDGRARRGGIPLPPGIELPVTTGNEFAGVVDAIGEGVSGISAGDPVVGRRTFGCVADYLVVAVSDIAIKPANLTFAEAATLGGTAQTADAAIETLAIGPGDVLLIHGAAGGVGTFAAQLALLSGATVIGTASAANQDHLSAIGAVPLVYGPGLAERIADAAPRGITAVLDCAGGSALDLSLTLGVPLSRISSVGDLGRVKELGIRGIEGVRDGKRLAKLLALAAQGKLAATVRKTFPMDEIVAAHRELDTGHGRGKIVIEVT